ncbi:MBL fold metallo-hydrolase [Metasolibacillus sp.]|uniref:MBL fold metallo-hydrolase n=1 Tax=Metasolibacillus sp. TaxID=2703680 RepID=UPI0025E5549B|nr:MBL fold metallo-hydrolase [Metasolibacillus sp.]MCT6922686.1 MBL fold metallo-hydrolase [Metasolibacillus sp.]MCT6938975.1 MBL fold metallo-hydrolase [Metasolibacillus sp.]
MLLKKQFEQGEINGVVYGNGTVAFQGVKLNVYCYIIDGVCIDTGAHSLRQQFQHFLTAQSFEQVVLTHHHEDHSGNAAFLQQQGVPIYIEESLLKECAKKAAYPLYRRLFWGARKPFQAQPLANTFTSKTATWEVIQTPGHAIDHVALLNKNTGQLFTGDLYVMTKTRLILREESIPAIIRSLQQVLASDFDEVFCSHAGLLKNGRKALQAKEDYLLTVQDKAFSLYEQGFTVSEIDRQLFSKKYPITRFSRGEWDSQHIVTSILKEANKI